MFEDVRGAANGQVRDVHHDAQAFEDAQSLQAEPGQSGSRLAVPAPACEQRVAHVGEGSHANPQLEERLEKLDVGADRMTTFESDDERELALVYCCIDVGTGLADRGYLGGRVDFLTKV